MKLLSIIVPVYNVEIYLERCLKSLINQKVKDLEIILVNDGSTDNSGVICDKYSKVDSRIKVIHKKNGGLSEARNYGLDIAKGKYIGFVDSDDFVSDNMFDVLLALAEEKNADIVACKYMRFYDGDKLLENNFLDSVVKEFDGNEALMNYFQQRDESEKEFLTVVWDKIYKRQLFREIRFPIGKIYEDGYVTYKLLYSASKLVHVNKPMYYYYQRENSLIRSEFSLKTLKSYDDWKEIFKFVYDNVPELKYIPAKRYIEKHFQTYKQIVELGNNKLEFNIYTPLYK